MKRTLVALVPVLALLAAGCGEVEQASKAASSTVARAEKMRADAANAPVAISALTTQHKVWECPTCQLDYDRAGKCPMDQTELKAMNVAYICPADNQPAGGAGKCPRCDQEVRIEKTAAADFTSSTH